MNRETLLDVFLKFLDWLFATEIQKKIVEISSIPKKGDKGPHVGALQTAINLYRGNALLSIDDDFGPKTEAAVQAVQRENGLAGSGIIGSKTLEILGLKVSESKPHVPPTKELPWLAVAYSHLGKKETDPVFAKYMASHWYLVSLSLSGIAKNYEAWCGLYMAYSYWKAGFEHAKNGALALNWGKWGLKIDFKKNGIPRGSSLHINHNGKASSSGNHVGWPIYDYTPEYLSNPENLIAMIGGNQSNSVRVSYFKVKTVLNCRWVNSKDYPLPGRITKTTHKGSGSTNDTTV